ncbi:MAG TPA: aldehyde ferredoxin oxidoreductase, partial [Clostridiales bacterium]|nr:aldehyde ferredoxin oxidoreductase [Clostridiales bacterium]
AVMGSKNLKAVVVRGRTGAEVPAADPGALGELVSTLVERAKENMVTRSLGEAGTVMGMDLGGLIGDVPLKNWTLGEWPEGLEKVGVGGYSEYLTGTGTCYACPIACKRKVTVRAYGRELEGAPGAEYESLACLGPNLQISDLPALLVAGETCNRLGLDTISAGITLGYAYEAADRGLLDGVLGPDEAERLKGAWGDAERMLTLLEDVAFRRGAGDVLAEGSAALAERIGRPEARAFLTTVKRLEAPAHDPRAAHGMAVAYAVSTRGACHMASLMYNAEHTGFSAPEACIDPDGVQQSSSGKGAQEKAVEDLGCVFGQAAVVCQLGGAVYGAEDLCAALEAVTGFGLSLEDLLETGARIWHLKRGIGNLYGVTSADDVLPPRFLEPLEEGGAAGSVPDIELMLEEWREARGLDENGRARREVLEGLGLGRLADLLGRLPAGEAAG